MITEKDGRSLSVRTPEELRGFLEKDLKSLTPEELEVLQLILKEMEGGKTGLLELMSELEFDEPCVDMETLILEVDGRQEYSTTEDTRDSGIKPVVRVTLFNGMSVKLTPDHRFAPTLATGWCESAATPRQIKIAPTYHDLKKIQSITSHPACTCIGIQVPMFGREHFEKDEPLAPHVILVDNPLWDDCLDELKRAKYFGFDIETYGRPAKNWSKGEALNPWKGRIRLISVGLPSGRAMVANLGGWDDDHALLQAKHEEFMQTLKKALESTSQITIGHNLSFDGMFVLCKFGWVIRNVRDTEVLSRVYWAGLGDANSATKKFPHSLKEVAWRLRLGDLDKAEQSSDYGWSLMNKQLNYSANDALIVVRIWKKLGAVIKAEGLEHSAKVECDAVPAFIHMMYHGMPLDLDVLEGMRIHYLQVKKDVIKPFADLFPGVNYASQKQVLQALNNRFKLGLTAVNDEELSEVKKPDVAVKAIKGLLLWRSVSIQDAYLQGILDNMFDFRIRTSFRQIGPSGQGRSTSSGKNGGVNLQNPANLTPQLKALGLKSVRSVFRARPGYKMIVADLSQAHSRIAACASKDKWLTEAYKKNLDVHSITAAGLAAHQSLPKEWSDPANIAKWRKDKSHPNASKANELRQLGKTVFYSSLNLSGAKTVQITARTSPEPVIMTEEEARLGIEAWRTTYAGLYRFQRNVIKKANKQDHYFPEFVERYAWMNKQVFGESRGLTGRRLFLMKEARDGFGLSVKGTDAVAFVWMSTEADAIKCALARIFDDICDHPEWDARICNFVHDEIDFEVKEEHAPALARRVLEHMNKSMQEILEDIPAYDDSVTPESLICDSWSDK